MQNLFRSVSSSRATRSAAQAAARLRQGQTVFVQRVNIRKPRNILRAVLVGSVVTYGCWHLYSSTVVKPLVRHLDKEFASLSAKEKKQIQKEVEEADNSIFIALPFTTKDVPSMPYKRSDPEWAKFVEISKDTQLQERIRSDITDVVRREVERHPFIAQKCGRVVKVKQSWLDIDFPYRPAPTFEQSGLLFDDEGIHWASEPIDSLTVFRLKKILWPTAMAQSSWAFTIAMANQHWVDFKKFLGLQSPPASDSATPRPNSEAVPQSKIPSAGRQTPDGTPAETTDSAAVNKTAESRPGSDARSGGKTSFLKDMAMSHVDGSRQMSSGPWSEFRKKLAQTWKSTRDYPPRGSVMVSGFVEVEASKGLVLIDVRSFWNPRTKTFDLRSMNMTLRRIQLKAPRRTGGKS